MSDVLLGMFLTREVEQSPQLIHLQVPLGSCLGYYLELAKRIERGYLVVNRIIDYGSDVTKVDVA